MQAILFFSLRAVTLLNITSGVLDQVWLSRLMMVVSDLFLNSYLDLY